MEFTKENTLKLMEEINGYMIDIRNTIEYKFIFLAKLSSLSFYIFYILNS